jgi:geranylgeranyl diphosphate synthase type I
MNRETRILIREALEHDLAEACVHLLDGGKGTRGALVRASFASVGGQPPREEPAVQAVELLHAFTLIHDDIMDGSLTRRRKPSVHAVYGVPMAILAGDALYTLAMRCVSDPPFCATQTRDAMRLVSTRLIEVANGQAMDLGRDAWRDPSSVLRVACRKTGGLFALACELGAVAGTARPGQRADLGSFGEKLGTAYRLKTGEVVYVPEEESGEK